MRHRRQSMKLLAGAAVLAAGVLGGCMEQPSPVLVTEAEAVTAAPEESGYGLIWVHVCGAVMQEGVYALPAGSRCEQAIEAAGGFRDDADRTALNLAAALEDGEQLRVLTREEASLAASKEAEASDGRVNINTATLEELMTLPGIGEARAQAILDYRESSGGFEQIEDIMQVPGIKEGAFGKLRDKIKVGTGNGKQGVGSG